MELMRVRKAELLELPNTNQCDAVAAVFQLRGSTCLTGPSDLVCPSESTLCTEYRV